MYKSNAEWSKDVYGYDNGVTSDKHETKEQAEAVCKMLERDGFGGKGKYFPIRTWVEEC